ncbi:MAG TPA: polyprenol phosphomannose-dependent alpha 1,6 mannosyltransferase MptB [Solirubrobacteraceae bacterium]|nr:polyprenol phosphomannose-dependent alpha 1,6 mannosyltransferase MptB [Solirubrobacteraceae bacterium]
MPDERLTGWGWPGLGLAGSLAITAAGPLLFGGGSTGWWFTLHVPGGHSGAVALFYGGMAALCLAWLGLGRRLRHAPGARTGPLLLVGALWCSPLVLGPPLFSHDVYSYMAQGEILHLGLNPYHSAPEVLARLGHPHLLATVSPFWRTTTSPYGPLFLGLASVITAAVGSHLIAGVLALRGLEIAALALLAVFVPRLARALRTDPARATWLAVISPLVLLELIAAGHNDALMIGLLVAGVTLAVERRPLLGVAVCALAATIKLPAVAGIAFIAVAWAREEFDQAGRGRNGTRAAARALALSAALTAAVLAAVSVATGLGASWVTSAVLSTPGKVHLAITPMTAAGWSFAALLHLLGIGANTRGIESALGVVALILTGVLALVLLRRARADNLVSALGTLLLVSVFAGPATWPWYLTWGLTLVACSAVAQRSWALPLAIVLAVFLVKANGILVLSIHTAPIVLAAYALTAGVLWRKRRGRRDSRSPGQLHRMPAAEQPALTNY